VDGQIVGFASLWEDEAFLHHLYVDPRYHRRGIGSALLQDIDPRGTRALSLKCQTENAAALGFYSRHGFIEGKGRGEDEFGPWVRLIRG
jgi:ribosomal protein S18 acetylase RimI-like enzyme